MCRAARRPVSLNGRVCVGESGVGRQERLEGGWVTKGCECQTELFVFDSGGRREPLAFIRLTSRCEMRRAYIRELKCERRWGN